MNQKGFMFKNNSEYRPGSLGGSVKLVLAAFMALAFVVAFSASAMAEVSIGGAAHGTFGNLSVENKVTTGGKTYTNKPDQGLRTDTQAQVDFKGGNGNVSVAYRLRVREGDNTGLAVQRNAVTWKPSEQLSLIFNGESFGRGSLVGYGISGGIGTMGDGTPIGDLYGGVTTFANTTGLDVNFNLGTMNVGVMILNDCVPGCALSSSGYTVHSQKVGDLTGVPGTGSADKNQQSIVPYFEGKFGAIRVGAFLSNASGDDSKTSASGLDDNDVSYESSAMNVNADFTTGNMNIGVVYATTTQSGNSNAANGGLADVTDLEGTNIAIGFKMDALRVRYTTQSTEWKIPPSLGTGTLKTDETEIAAAYTLNVGGVSVIPQFAQRNFEWKDEPAGPQPDKYESAQTYIALGVATSF